MEPIRFEKKLMDGWWTDESRRTDGWRTARHQISSANYVSSGAKKEPRSQGTRTWLVIHVIVDRLTFTGVGLLTHLNGCHRSVAKSSIRTTSSFPPSGISSSLSTSMNSFHSWENFWTIMRWVGFIAKRCCIASAMHTKIFDAHFIILRDPAHFTKYT